LISAVAKVAVRFGCTKQSKILKRYLLVRLSHLSELGAYLIPLTCYGAGNLARVNRLILSKLSGL
jgi:hypothetical protein